MFGAGFGDVMGHLAPGVTGPIGAYALVGMGGVFAGAARGPITAVLIMFGLSGMYTIILPLMLAIVLATAVSKALSKDTVYTLKLRRRGVDLTAPQGDPRLREGKVRDHLEPAPLALDPSCGLRTAARLVLGGGHPALPIVDRGKLLGVVTARAVAEAFTDAPEPDLDTVRHLAELPPRVTPEDSLFDALSALTMTDGGGVPVVDAEGCLVGWLSHRAVLSAVTPATSAPLAATA